MDALFNMFKVKFSKLDELMTKHCTEITPDSKINLFINLEPILKKLVAANIDDYLKVRSEEKTFEMISNIINLAAHYRLFFTKNKLYSKVYLYMNHPFKTDYKNRNINPDYRKYFEHRYTKNTKTTVLGNTLSQVLPFTKIILDYVDGVYLIEAESIESSLVPHIITNESKSNEINFVLSNDKYDYQYANKGFHIIRPKKEESYIINQSNLIQMIKTEEKIVNDIEVESHFYPFILSLLGDKYRNIDKIKRIGLASLLKTIKGAIDNDIISKDVHNINILANIIKDEYRGFLLANYYCVDIDTQFQMLNIKDLYSITSQVNDKFDNVALKKINDQYFKLHPILLLELTGANNLIKKKKRNDIFLKGR
jgi:hypothetical protein